MSINVHVIRCDGPPTAAPTLEGQHWINTVTGEMWFANGTASVANWVLLEADTDVKVKVSATDTTAGYLADKTIAGTGIILTTLNGGGDEDLEIKIDTSVVAQDSFKTINTPLGTDPVADSPIDILNLTSSDGSVIITGDATTDTVGFKVDTLVTDQNLFETISTPNGTSPVADSPTDTLNLISSDNSITITGNAVTDTVDFTVDQGSLDYGTPVTQNPDIANTEGISTEIARADHIHNIPADTAIGLDASSSNTEGTSASFARADHTHDLSTGTPSTQNPDQANAEGTSSNLARADHIHNIPADVPSTLNPDQSNTEGTSTSFARADHIHNVPADVPVAIGAANAEGTSTSFARADHIHNLVTSGGIQNIGGTISPEYAAPVTQNPDQANATGTSNKVSMADHVHNIPADAPTTTLSPATLNAEGIGTSFSRNDHTHSIATALVGDISSIEPDDTASAGILNNYARGDHQHAILADIAVDIGIANAEGTSSSFSRADHIHRGVRSIKQNAGSQRFGDLSLQNGIGITVTDDGVGNFTITASGASLTDEKVKISATDTTAGYLNDELVVGTGLTKTILSPAANEQIQLKITDTTVTPSTYGTATKVSSFIVNQQGQLTLASEILIAIPSTQITDFTEAVQDAIGLSFLDTVTIDLTYNDGLNQISADLKNTTVTAAAYGSATQVATFTVDAQGRLTLAANVSIAIPSTQITDFTEAAQDAVFSILVDSSTIDFTYNDAANTVTAVVLQSGLTFGTPVTQNPDQANTEGVSTNIARSDHVHNIPADAPTTTLSPATLNTEGIGTSFARNDHTHAIATALAADLSTINPDDAAIAGILNNYARGDHQHAIATVAPVDIGSANTEGAATDFVRSDHVHRGVRSIKALAGGTQRFGDIVLEQGTNITIVDSPAGTMTINSTNQIGTGLKIKSGTVTAGSFAGSPKTYSVVFGTAFASTSYAINITGSDNRNWSWESKTTTGFVINANAGAALTGNTDWTAILIGESN